MFYLFGKSFKRTFHYLQSFGISIRRSLPRMYIRPTFYVNMECVNLNFIEFKKKQYVLLPLHYQ